MGRSRLEIPVDVELKEYYSLGYHERLRLEARGKSRWYGEQVDWRSSQN